MAELNNKPRSLYFTGPMQVEILESPMEMPAGGDLQVATVLSGISAGTEMLVYRGEMPGDQAVDETIASLQGKLEYPLKYGYAAVGRVQEAHGVRGDLAPGALVFSFQPHQTHFLAKESEVILLPPDISAENAVFLPNIETALGFVMDAAPLAGERVAVLGQGVVGLLTTAVLAEFPLERLVTFDSFVNRREKSVLMGAGEASDPNEIPTDLLKSFDLVFELSGNPSALDAAIELTGQDGRIVVGSWYGTKRSTVDLGGHFHRGRLRLISSQVSRLAPELGSRWTKARRMTFAIEMARRIAPSRLITHTIPFNSAAEAYQMLDKHPEKTIQVVLEY